MKQPLRQALLLALLGLSPLAEAHAPIKDIGAFYNGMLHPLLVPAHLIGLLVLGLLAGQQGLQSMRRSLAVFCLAVLLGLASGIGMDEALAQSMLLLTAAVLGVLLALAVRLPSWVVWSACALLGLLLGLDSLPHATGWQRSLLGGLGTWLGACVVLLAVMVFAEAMTRSWQRIGLRILGAWIGSSALLVLSLMLVLPGA